MLVTKTQGFTLAELLISLAILGVIATFTIPKILASQQNGQRIAVFKETIATISQVLWEGYQKGEITSGSGNYSSYIINNVNALKLCTTNSLTEGCWTHTDASGIGETTQPGFVLPNGATIAGLETNPNFNNFLVDWNGATGPNILGDDQIWLRLCANSQGISCNTVKPWTIGPFQATSTTLFRSIFQ